MSKEEIALDQKIKELKTFIREKTDLGVANYLGKEIREICGMVEQLTSNTVSKERELPSKEEVKKHVESLPYYGTCTYEYKEGFEEGVEWVKKQLNNGR